MDAIPTNGGRLAEKIEQLEHRAEKWDTDLKEINGRLSSHDRMDPCAVRWEDMEGRMRKVESFRWQIIGALLLINGIGVTVILTAIRAWSR